LKIQIAGACLLLAGVAVAQSSSPSPSLKPRPASPAQNTGSAGSIPGVAGAEASAETSNVAPDAAVITIEGLCEKGGGGSGTPTDCKTVVTRAEFDKVANTFQPNMPVATRKQLANHYAVWLYLAEKAHEFGLDHGPAFDDKMAVVRLEVLAQLAGERVHQEAGKVTDGEIGIYYHDHISDYKTISYDRLLVPKQKQVDSAGLKANDPDLQKKREASEAEMKAEADKLRARAASGEDFAKLQQEAYDFGGYTQIKAPNPHVDKARKDRIPPAHVSIFELKVGDVSQVFGDPSGFVVYKVAAIEDMPLASVHDDISRKLASDREKSQIESLQSSTKLNDAYFGAPAPPPPTLRNPGEAAPTPAPAPGKP
jgi:hypothetical protein